MEELNILTGDQIRIKGKKRAETICIALAPEDELPDNTIRLDKQAMKNARVTAGTQVHVTPITELPNLNSIKVLPFKDTMEGLTGDIN